jgi:dephospho-CoA kinase
MIVVGLTGSIGMGKTATAKLFAEEGARVHDADAAVHALYAKGGSAIGPIEAAFPGAVVNGEVDRKTLSARVTGDADALARLEAIVHPLVARVRDDFIAQARAEGAPVVVLDIPLLFEAGQHRGVDVIVVASAPAGTQRARVLARPGMTQDKLDALLERQLPDAEKRARADFVVETGEGFGAARRQVRHILQTVQAPGFRPRRPLAGPGEASH